MSEITLQEVIAASYGLTTAGIAPPALPSKANTALLLIDIQGLATPEYMGKRAVEAGLPEDQVTTALADYKTRFYDAVGACSRLLAKAREVGIPPIHVKIEALGSEARDTSMLHKMLGWSFPPGCEAARFLPETEPNPGEIVLTKTVSSAFTGTMLDRVLRHMGILYLFICGFVTDECVETTARDALDHGYLAPVVADATTAYFVEAHAHLVTKMSGFGLAPSSDEVMMLFAGIAEA